MSTLLPPEDWEPLPKEKCEERYEKPGSSLAFHTRWTDEMRQLLESGQVEVDWRTVVDKPDSRNKYWWRIKPQGFSFDRLYVGDVLSCPYPACCRLRLRVREIEMVYDFGPKGHSKDKHPQYVLQLYSVLPDGRGKYGWLDRSHDRRNSIKGVKAEGYRLIEKAPGQPSLF